MDSLNLFRSKVKKDLLLLFFTNPEQKYYVRQLTKQLNTSPGTVHREVKNLENSGLIISERVGNIVQYRANVNSPLFEEIKSIIFKTVGIAGYLKDMIDSIEGIKFAFIYGSYSKQSEDQNSDVDFMIVGNVNAQGLSKELYEYEKKIERDITFNVYSLKEWNSYKNSKDSFITGIIEGPKIWLKGGESDL